LQCVSVFEEDAIGHSVGEGQGLCRFTLHRPWGDVMVLIDADLQVQQGLMQTEPGSDFRPIYEAFCTHTTRVGLEQVPGLMIPQEEVLFAFRSIYQERVRMDMVGRSCGPTLALQNSTGGARVVQVQSLQLASEHSFTIRVFEQGRPGVTVPVQVRIMRKTHWQGDDHTTQSAYTFLGSTPAPCDISPSQDVLNRRLFDVETMFPASSNSSIVTASLSSSSKQPPRALKNGAHGSTGSGSGGVQVMPSEYDFRRHRPKCLGSSRGQGVCGSSWAAAALGAFEKQMCRLSDSQVSSKMSLQWLLNCAVQSSGCDGGSPQHAHASFLQHGAVADSCLSYSSGMSHRPNKDVQGGGFCREGLLRGCDDNRAYARNPNAYELNQATAMLSSGAPSSNTLWAVGEQNILLAILGYGAVVTTMAVFADLLEYRSGVYRQKSMDFQGRTNIQLAGWGIEPKSGDAYWIAESAWGSKWGENQSFAPCSVRDCMGEFCPADNGNPDCFDSTTWTDSQGFNCAWYTKNDPGCALYVDAGQKQLCPKSCKTCKSRELPAGERCGYFRVVRGINHCGIEALALHTFVSSYSPSVEETMSIDGGVCINRADWNDAYGNGCSWYASRSCSDYPDVGQFASCKVACGSCGRETQKLRVISGWAEALLSKQRGTSIR